MSQPLNLTLKLVGQILTQSIMTQRLNDWVMVWLRWFDGFRLKLPNVVSTYFDPSFYSTITHQRKNTHTTGGHTVKCECDYWQNVSPNENILLSHL